MGRYSCPTTLYLADRLISTPTASRPSHPHSEAHKDALPPALAAPRPTGRQPVLLFLPFPPPPRLLESLERYVIQPLILDTELAPVRPEVAAVPVRAEVERVARAPRAREPVDGLAAREAVEAQEVHQEAAAVRGPARARASGVCVRGVGRRVRVRVAVAHLTVKARAAAAAHEAVAPEVGYLESGHLARNLPELRSEENGGPRELEGRPQRDGDEERVGCGEHAERGGEGA
ncbi:hypothetical protein C8R44DRAFT_152186 [Mycena epipterygia]|nr:hypothetical protein C8R44DRAFT_152186 [Mycena epipterygia]